MLDATGIEPGSSAEYQLTAIANVTDETGFARHADAK